MEGFTGITICLKVIRNIELPLRSIAVKQNLLVLQPKTARPLRHLQQAVMSHLPGLCCLKAHVQALPAELEAAL